MESIKLTDGKILVILTEEEVSALGGGVAEKAVSSLLPGIAAAGFADPDGTLKITLFESARGGCQIFFEAIRGNVGDGRRNMEHTKSGCGTDPSFFGTGERRGGETYRFDDAPSLLRACLALSLAYRGDSSLSCLGGSFYLTLCEGSPIPGEFGGTAATERERAALKESERVAPTGAVGLLAPLAV